MAEGILNSYISLYIPQTGGGDDGSATTDDTTTKEDPEPAKEPEPVVPAETPTGKTDDEIKSGSPPESAEKLIENFNQLFDSDPGAALTYLFDNFAVLFKFWWSIIYPDF